MILRAGVAAALAMALISCGDKQEPVADTEITSAPATETVAVSAKSGEDIFKKCVACHTVTKGGANGIGPNLHGIVGRKVASVEGFIYSTAMKAKGGVWDEANLDAYIAGPAKTVVGTKMMFAGISDSAERQLLIEYLAAQK